MKKMYVVYGEIDSGKTHTMWLVLSYLLKKGATLLEMYHVDAPLSYEKIMNTKTRLPDFRAVMEWYGKKIMLLSAGDFLKHYYWGFRVHIEWAIKYKIDYVICCARSRNRKGSVLRELLEVYRGTVLSDEDWFFVEQRKAGADWLLERDKIAIVIVSKLLSDIDKEN